MADAPGDDRADGEETRCPACGCRLAVRRGPPPGDGGWVLRADDGDGGSPPLEDDDEDEWLLSVDEADASVGRRTDVVDAHDRYVNRGAGGDGDGHPRGPDATPPSRGRPPRPWDRNPAKDARPVVECPECGAHLRPVPSGGSDEDGER